MVVRDLLDVLWKGGAVLLIALGVLYLAGVMQ